MDQQQRGTYALTSSAPQRRPSLARPRRPTVASSSSPARCSNSSAAPPLSPSPSCSPPPFKGK
uniref:Uncharacterized protein n=1 Tax=Arundo donax TaxID=35708 RepID=A0A0A9GF67_ARUDO